MTQSLRVEEPKKDKSVRILSTPAKIAHELSERHDMLMNEQARRMLLATGKKAGILMHVMRLSSASIACVTK